MGVLSHDVVEDILERVPVKSLGRFKSVSKQWKSTIESNNFQRRQMIHRQQSRGPDILFVNDYDNGDDFNNKNISSSSSSVIPIVFPFKKKFFCCTTSCDGLVGLYNPYESIVINPTTKWHRKLPTSNLQQQRMSQSLRNQFGFSWFGFGKDKFNGTYKQVWLYSPKLETITMCEVFDFSTNAWRYVTPAPPTDIIPYFDPVYVDGSLYWLTKYEIIAEVLSFDLHTETFQFIAKPPFVHAPTYMCNLNNRLCISETKWPNQVIWLLDSGSKTWIHMHSIELKMTYSLFRLEMKWNSGSIHPVAVLEEKNTKTKVLFYFETSERPDVYFVIYDGQTKSYYLAFTFKSSGDPLCYYQSLISIL